MCTFLSSSPLQEELLNRALVAYGVAAQLSAGDEGAVSQLLEDACALLLDVSSSRLPFADPPRARVARDEARAARLDLALACAQRCSQAQPASWWHAMQARAPATLVLILFVRFLRHVKR